MPTTPDVAAIQQRSVTPLLAGWSKVTTTFRVGQAPLHATESTATTGTAHAARAAYGSYGSYGTGAGRRLAAPAPTAVPQLMFAPPAPSSCGGCKSLGVAVWIDDVAIELL